MPLLTLEHTISKLLSKETHLGIKTSTLDSVLIESQTLPPAIALAASQPHPTSCNNSNFKTIYEKQFMLIKLINDA